VSSLDIILGAFVGKATIETSDCSAFCHKTASKTLDQFPNQSQEDQKFLNNKKYKPENCIYALKMKNMTIVRVVV
jgi:hypothetical protein